MSQYIYIMWIVRKRPLKYDMRMTLHEVMLMLTLCNIVVIR